MQKKIDIVGENSSDTDILNRIEQSLDFENKDINTFDVMRIIALMPNQRYRKLIEIATFKNAAMKKLQPYCQ